MKRVSLLPAFLPLAPLLLATACVAEPPREPVSPAPLFDALAFFDGRAEGVASLKVIFAAAHTIRVHSHGVRQTDGSLVLDQIVEEAGKKPRTRQWHIRETSPNHYAGTLSDAASAITGETSGNRLHLHFTMKGGMDTNQWLTLAPDGQSAHNIMVVRKLGLTLAVLDETITRTAPTS